MSNSRAQAVWDGDGLLQKAPGSRLERVAAVVVIALSLVGASCTSTSATSSSGNSSPIRSSKALGTTHGPNGEKATPESALRLTPREVARVRAGHYTAAFVWHQNSEFVTAVSAGARHEFKLLGIEVTAQASANFDAAKQKAELEAVTAKKPSVLLTLPVDPVVTASAYKAVARDGTKIVLLSIVPQGMKYGDYVSLVTDDLLQMGNPQARVARSLGALIWQRFSPRGLDDRCLQSATCCCLAGHPIGAGGNAEG